MTSPAATTGRLIPWSVHDAAQNMAIDEALLQSVAAGAPATLRLYGWSKPTLSLGYFQSHQAAGQWTRQKGNIFQASLSTAENRPHPLSSDPSADFGNEEPAPELPTGVAKDGLENESFEMVRRCTGGGAILHHFELTYSLVLPMPRTETGARTAVYQGVHAAAVDTLAQWRVASTTFRELDLSTSSKYEAASSRSDDPFLCFQRRTDEDVIVSGYKILGSAQRRGRGALLQHGSLLLAASPFADELPGIAELTGVRIAAASIAEPLALRIADFLGHSFLAGQLSAQEQSVAESIREERFGNPSWTTRR